MSRSSERPLVLLAGHRFLHFAAEPDQLGPLFAPLRAPLGDLADVLVLAVDIEDQRLQLALEADVVVRTAQPALVAELVEGDPADRAGLLIQLRQLLGGLTDGHLLGHLLGQGRGHARGPGRLFAGLREVLPGVLLAKVQLLRLAPGQLRNVERGGLIAFLTFHQHELLTRPRHQDSNTRPPPVNPSRRPPAGPASLLAKGRTVILHTREPKSSFDRAAAPSVASWAANAGGRVRRTPQRHRGHCLQDRVPGDFGQLFCAHPLYGLEPSPLLPRFRPLLPPGPGGRPGAGLPPAGERLADARHRLPQARRRPLLLPGRERGRRREGGPLQLPGDPSLLRDRGLRQAGDDQLALRRVRLRRPHSPDPAVRLRRPLARAGPAGRVAAGGHAAGAAAVCGRGRGLCRLRRGPLPGTPPQRPAGRSPRAGHGLRLLRSDGGLRPCHQVDRGRGPGPAR